MRFRNRVSRLRPVGVSWPRLPPNICTTIWFPHSLSIPVAADYAIGILLPPDNYPPRRGNACLRPNTMLARNLLVILGFTGVCQAVYFYTRLPDTVAIHFRTSGIPDGWASNEANLVISICLYVFIAGIFWPFHPASKHCLKSM